MRTAALLAALALSACATTREVRVGERPSYPGCTKDETGLCAPRVDATGHAQAVVGTSLLGR